MSALFCLCPFSRDPGTARQMLDFILHRRKNKNDLLLLVVAIYDVVYCMQWRALLTVYLIPFPFRIKLQAWRRLDIDFVSIARIEGSFILISLLWLFHYRHSSVCVSLFFHLSSFFSFFFWRSRALVDDWWFMHGSCATATLLWLLFTLDGDGWCRPQPTHVI